MKKKLIKILPIVVIVIMLLLISLCWYLVSPVKNKSEEVDFKIDKNTSTKDIIYNLRVNNLIKSQKFTYVFVKLNNFDSIKAGKFKLNRNMSLREIIKTITNIKNAKEDNITLTFHEGNNMRDIIKIIVNNTDISENDILSLLSNKTYIKSLMNDYWFLTDDILNDNIYYPLEGYLAPDTYEFKKDVSIKEIFKKMLDQEEIVLGSFKNSIDKSNISIHNLITLASICELEGKSLSDRENIVGVFYNRINNNLPLGSDVTTYYAAKIDMGDRDLTVDEINSNNLYNTRNMNMRGKLPVGPICNPSKDAIEATLNYKKNNYLYFVADKNGKVYFSTNESEHTKIIQNLKDNNLWYEY